MTYEESTLLSEDIAKQIKTIKRKHNRIIMIVVFISFLCSLPFDIFILRHDWEKDNSIEILRQNYPAQYEKWTNEVDVDDPNNPYGDTPDIKYFSRPIHTISFILGIPFFTVLGLIAITCYWLVIAWVWLPKLVQYLIMGIIWLFTMLYTVLWVQTVLERWHNRKIKQRN